MFGAWRYAPALKARPAMVQRRYAAQLRCPQKPTPCDAVQRREAARYLTADATMTVKGSSTLIVFFTMPPAG
jgi:hypothetical protein